MSLLASMGPRNFILASHHDTTHAHNKFQMKNFSLRAYQINQTYCLLDLISGGETMPVPYPCGYRDMEMGLVRAGPGILRGDDLIGHVPIYRPNSSRCYFYILYA